MQDRLSMVSCDCWQPSICVVKSILSFKKFFSGGGIMSFIRKSFLEKPVSSKYGLYFYAVCA